jgi:hypothetical protein
MQSVAKNGYHIPSLDELESLLAFMKVIRPDTYISEYVSSLLFTFAGKRNSSSADIEGSNSIGFYWSSSPDSSFPSYACRLVLRRSEAKTYRDTRVS